MIILSVDPYSITSVNSQEFTGFENVTNIETISVDIEVHTLDPNVETKTRDTSNNCNHRFHRNCQD
jgi:hypothetical protein